MLHQVTLLSVIEGIYAAAEDPQRWAAVLQRCTDLAGCKAGGLYVSDLVGRTATISVAVNCDESYLRSYEAYYAAKDPWSERANRLGLFAPGTVLLSDEILSTAALHKTEHYSDWLAPQRLRRAANLCLAKDVSLVANISLLRSQTHGEFSDEQIETLRVLTPHLQRAIHLHQRLAASETLRRSLADVLDDTPNAVLLLAASGSVIYTNRPADLLLNLNDGLQVQGRRLTMSDTRAAIRLQELVADAAVVGKELSSRGGGVVRCERPSQKRGFELLVVPIRSLSNPFVGAPPAVAVFVADPDARSECDREVWKRLYRLTEAESQLALLLANGETVEAASGILGISTNTTKTHLKNLFAKTDTHRQAELLRHLTSGVSSIRTR